VLAAINADLAQQSLLLKIVNVVGATIVAAVSSTKSRQGEGESEMQQTN
jgi:hypothetical protein